MTSDRQDGTSEDLRDDHNHSLMYGDNEHTLAADQLWVYAGLPILVVGTVGHVLSLLVVLGSRRMRMLSLSVYLVASAISGLLSLHVGLLRQILLRLDEFKKDVREETSDAGCRIHTALTYFSLQLFSWIQASVAVERVVAVWRPLRYKQWCTLKTGIILVSAVAISLAALNIIVIDSYSLDSNNICKAWKPSVFNDVWRPLDLVLFAGVPILIMVPCNLVIVFHIFRNSKNKRNTSASFSNRKSRQFTIMLLVHNILCIFTTLPISVVVLLPGWNHPGAAESSTRWTEWTVFNLLQYLGTMLGFSVYNILAQRFRQATRDLFCKGFNANANSTDSNGPSNTGRVQCESRGSRFDARVRTSIGMTLGSQLVVTKADE